MKNLLIKILRRLPVRLIRNMRRLMPPILLDLVRGSVHPIPSNIDGFKFESYLANSIFFPITKAPFSEENKKAFSVMECLRKKLVITAKNLSEPPLISIIMPCFNNSKSIGRAIESILRQSYNNWELIISDDGSTDSTLLILNHYIDPRIKILKSPRNTGSAAARNRALHDARGSLITYLDSDNWMHEDFLAAMLGVMILNPEADLSYCAQYLYSEGLLKPSAVRFSAFHFSLLRNVNFIDINCVMHRDRIVKNGIFFDEKLTRLADWDFVLKVSFKYKIISAPILLSHYNNNFDVNRNTLKNNFEINRLGIESNLKSYEKFSTEKKLKLKRPVSIIIPNYESLETLKECVLSIQLTLSLADREVIIVDNNSSASVIQFLKKLNPEEFKVIFLPKNYGFTYAVKIGIDASTSGNDIILMNNDAYFFEEAVQNMQESAYQSEEIGIVAPQQILPVGHKTILTHVPAADINFECDVNLSFHHRNILEMPIFHDGVSLNISFANFFCVYIKRNVINEIGSLDPEFGRHYRSDRTFCDFVRCYLKKRIVYTSRARVFHHVQKSTTALAASDDFAYGIIFKDNSWSEEFAKELGYRKAAWDF